MQSESLLGKAAYLYKFHWGKLVADFYRKKERKKERKTERKKERKTERKKERKTERKKERKKENTTFT